MTKELQLTSWEKWYVKRITNDIKKKWEEKIDDLYEKFKTNLENKINELSDKLENFSNFYENLFNWDEENKPIKTEIEWYIENLTWKLDNIQTKYDTLIDWDNWIIKYYETSKSQKDEIKWLLDEVNPLVNKINEYYDKIFWKEDENWNRKWWIKEEIEKRKQEYTDLKNKIESLLSWATSVWLAAAYQKHKKTFTWQKWLWSIIFILSLAGMILSYLFIKIDNIPEIQAWWWGFVRFLIRFPITVPFIWLALFSWKQQNKYQRLEQEYAYKESLCKSFEWYRKEIEKFEDTESAKQLQINLFNVIIKMSSYNPSITLESKSNNEKSPYWTAMEKAPDLVESFWKTVKQIVK